MSRASPQQLSEAVIVKALDLGFEGVGITSPDLDYKVNSRLQTFLDAGWQGDMFWMREKKDRRCDPLTLWPDVRSIVVVAMNYAPAHDPMSDLSRSEIGVVSAYARGDDYHNVMKKRLKELGRWLGEEHKANVRVYVDTAPVMEKPLANKAGLGWQGKHTNLVSRSNGSWLVLGVLFTDVELHQSKREIDHCGSCSACQDICPTDAFPEPYMLDARRCISYLTIEFKGHIPREFRQSIGNRIYGCDDCLAVCPWNKFAQVAREVALQTRIELALPRLADLVQLDDASFREFFSKSPIKRIGRDRFVRNVLIAIGNTKKPSMGPVVLDRIKDTSPLVRAMAVWAISRLITHESFIKLRHQHISDESNAAVIEEWIAEGKLNDS